MAEKLTNAEAQAVLDSTPVLFGLAQQGHLPLVKELRAAGHGFTVIGNRIGWDAKTAAEHYCFHLEARIAALESQAATREAKLRELVEKTNARITAHRSGLASFLPGDMELVRNDLIRLLKGEA